MYLLQNVILYFYGMLGAMKNVCVLRHVLWILADFKPVYQGFGWLHDLASPDPYFVVPICVGILSLINIHVGDLMRVGENVCFSVF